MAGSILGNRVTRLEDPELLTGDATYVYDLDLADPLYLIFVRSPFAHARLAAVDTSAAEAAAGVAAVFTAANLGVAPHHGFVPVDEAYARPPLAVDRVRFVGEAVVAILAESLVAGRDAAELVDIDYEPLDAAIDPEDALADGAPLVFDDRPGNLAFVDTDAERSDLFADAERVVRGRYLNQRVAAVPMEPNSFAAVPGDDGAMTVYAATQMPHLLQRQLSRAVGIDRGQLRVIAPHVGGGFGAKAGLYHEYSVVTAVARALGRPVTWTEDRSEDMVALAQSRAQIQYVELGVRADGTFTGMRVRLVGDAGAYPGIGAMLPAGTKRMSQGTYRMPAMQFDIAVATTNTTPTGAYRGAGRPEAASLVERVVDQAALEIGMDPLEIRRRNFLADDVFPYRTLTGVTYDSGNYRLPLERAAELAGYDELRRDQAGRRDRADVKQLGIGVASYVEITAGGGAKEYGAVEINEDGTATVRCGTSAHGQGHETAFAMIVSDRLGIPIEDVRLVQSDTALVRSGGGTGGSRSLQVGGSAVLQAAEAVLQKARALAAHVLEANVDDIAVTDDGRVGVAGVPATALTWAELAKAAAAPDLPDDVVDHEDGTVGLAAQLDFDQGEASFPFGTHIAVVEVDTETGDVELLRHIAVDDAGTVVNPLLVAGQQHGGVAQGAAQALYEQVVFDDDGNPLTATLMDYLMPSAAELPSFEVHSTETPSPLNPLGAKGIGEAGTIGATPAVQNAVIDALSPLGIRHLDMPCSPQRVWAAIQAARHGAPPDPWRDPPPVFDHLPRQQLEEDDERLQAAEGI